MLNLKEIVEYSNAAKAKRINELLKDESYKLALDSIEIRMKDAIDDDDNMITITDEDCNEMNISMNKIAKLLRHLSFNVLEMRNSEVGTTVLKVFWEQKAYKSFCKNVLWIILLKNKVLFNFVIY